MSIIGGRKMKHIVYLDTDVLNSYISQIYDGLIKSNTQETGDQNQQQHHTSEQSSQAKFSVGLKGLLGTEVNDGIFEEGSTLSNTEYGRELIEKIFHDNAIDHVIKNIEAENLLKKNWESIEVGDYIYLSSNYDILDMDYFARLFSKENYQNIAALCAYPMLQQFKESSPEQRKLSGFKTEKQILETNEKGIFGENQELISLMQALNLLFPCSKLVLGDNFCAPVKNKFLRENMQEMAFKYSDQITIFGKVTSSTDSQAKTNSFLPNEISNLTKDINRLVFEMLHITDSWIVTPIALFFQ